jgi:ribokinase
MTAARVAVVASYAAGLSMEVDRLPGPGETRIGRGFAEGPGGKGSNQAIQAARLGAEVGLVACVGDDAYGRAALDLWSDEGIRTEHVLRDSDQPTGVGFILVDAAGQNSIALDPGANGSLGKRAVDDARPVFEESIVCLVQLEIPLSSAAYALARAKEAGCITLLNPAPARRIPDEVWPSVDVVIPNEGEAGKLLRNETCSTEAAGEELIGKVNLAAVITLGSDGVLVFDKSGKTERFPAFAVDVRDTTGAGDAFTGAFGTRLAQGGSLEEAVEWGTAAGALACTVPGVVPSLADRAALLGLLSNGERRPIGQR